VRLKYIFILILFVQFCSTEKETNKSTVALVFFPNHINFLESESILSPVYNNLLHKPLLLLDDKSTIEPSIIESWELLGDSLTYLFTIDTTMKFSDGSSITSSDILQCFRRFKKGKSSLSGIINSIEILDKERIKIILKSEYSAFLRQLTNIQYFKVFKIKSESRAVTTGPYEITDFVPKNSITLSSNRYYEKDIFFENVILKKYDYFNNFFKIIEDKVDFISFIPSRFIEKIYYEQEYKVHTTNRNSISFLGFNLKSEIFKKKENRILVFKLLELNDIYYKLVKFNIDFLINPLTPNTLGYNENINQYNEYRNYRIDTRATRTGEIKIVFFNKLATWIEVLVKYIKSRLEAIGFKVNVIAFDDWNKYNKRVKEDDTDIFLDGWINNTFDADYTLFPLFYSKSEDNLFNYRSLAVDSLLLKSRKTYDNEERERIFFEIQRRIIDDLPCIFLVNPIRVSAIRKDIKNFEYDKYGNFDITKIFREK